MNRQSEPVSVPRAEKNEERVFFPRGGPIPSRLPLLKARRMLKAKKSRQNPQGVNIKKRIFQHVAYPSCQVIILALLKKLLVQPKKKTRYPMAVEALFLNGHGYAL